MVNKVRCGGSRLPVILIFCEAEAGKTQVQAQPGQLGDTDSAGLCVTQKIKHDSILCLSLNLLNASLISQIPRHNKKRAGMRQLTTKEYIHPSVNYLTSTAAYKSTF